MPLIEPADAARDLNGVVPLATEKRDEDAAAATAIVVDSDCYRQSLADKNANRVQAAQALANRRVLDPIRKDPRRYGLSAPIDAGAATSAPVLIVSGRQDQSVGYRDAWRLVEQYPRATYIALDRAEHGFPIDRMNAALFRVLVNDWLDRVEERVSSRKR